MSDERNEFSCDLIHSHSSYKDFGPLMGICFYFFYQASNSSSYPPSCFLLDILVSFKSLIVASQSQTDVRKTTVAEYCFSEAARLPLTNYLATAMEQGNEYRLIGCFFFSPKTY